MGELESWQKVPAKIIIEAIKHGRKQTDEDNFLSFLLLDVGMEMVFKTYLTLPRYLTGANTSEDERFMASRKGFHDVVEAVKSSRKGISVEDIAKVSFFHGIRNKLYHQGNGLTVAKEIVDEYINVAARLTNQLLKLDIVSLISSNGLSVKEQELVLKLRESINTNIDIAKNLRVELTNVYELAVEKVEQALLMPSFKRKFEKIQNNSYSEDGYSYHDGEVVSFKKLPNYTKKRLAIVNELSVVCDEILKKITISRIIVG